jgi:hypothetical protein
MRKLALLLLVLAALAVVGCGMSRSDAADWANEYCAPHGGVNTQSQNGFYYSTDGDGEVNVTCADGTVGARRG